jgi:hypothetical protein
MFGIGIILTLPLVIASMLAILLPVGVEKKL